MMVMDMMVAYSQIAGAERITLLLNDTLTYKLRLTVDPLRSYRSGVVVIVTTKNAEYLHGLIITIDNYLFLNSNRIS